MLITKRNYILKHFPILIIYRYKINNNRPTKANQCGTTQNLVVDTGSDAAVYLGGGTSGMITEFNAV